ncbi:uncharacterized protein [Parasteatoda tepidariorum]|uniref:uncharacterized protein n=1 Tax=Parasteatoda tepidariorum TaxID=114398 RepID=UPI0039BCECD2
MIRDPKNDLVKLNFDSLKESIEISEGKTKRTVLRSVAKIFDPVGYLQPFIVRVKIILQDSWLLGLDWDTIFPPDLNKRWMEWCSETKYLKNPEFPRKFFQSTNYTQLTAHIFCDATPRAFGAVAYFRYIDETGEIKTSFIMAKGRVAPLKSLSLPRCELMGAVAAAKLAKYLKSILPKLCDNIHFWCDSMITLCWIRKSPNVWKPFVANRVAEIKNICDPNQWHHCSGSENPADLLSRGERAETIFNSSLWQNGPSWLLENEISWPKGSIVVPDEQLVNNEMRKHLNVFQTATGEDNLQNSHQLLDLNKYSELSKVHRITAWVHRFVHNSNPSSEKYHGPLTAFE